jgi:hypothetical protein
MKLRVTPRAIENLATIADYIRPPQSRCGASRACGNL